MFTPGPSGTATPGSLPVHGLHPSIPSKNVPLEATRGRALLDGTPAVKAARPAVEQARFAEEWPEAVSLGWGYVIHLLESCCKDPDTRKSLRTLSDD